MVAAGTLLTTIERTYPLEGVPEAFRHIGEERALGKLVIEMAAPQNPGRPPEWRAP